MLLMTSLMFRYFCWRNRKTEYFKLVLQKCCLAILLCFYDYLISMATIFVSDPGPIIVIVVVIHVSHT